MRFNLNNPAFLQAAGNAREKEYISFVDATGNPEILQLSARGNVTIQSIYNGKPISQTVTNPTDTDVQIQSDANTEVVLFGQITKLYCDPGPGSFTDFTRIDVSHAKSLTILSCSSNQLTSLDVSANTALTILSCEDNQTLLTIDGIGVNDTVARGIASAITAATSVDGTVTLRQGDEFNQTIIDAAMEKGWDVQYYAS